MRGNYSKELRAEKLQEKMQLDTSQIQCKRLYLSPATLEPAEGAEKSFLSCLIVREIDTIRHGISHESGSLRFMGKNKKALCTLRSLREEQGSYYVVIARSEATRRSQKMGLPRSARNDLSPITYYPSPITCYPSPITYHLLPITYYPSPITYHLLPITYHLSPITYYPSPITFHFSLFTI